MEHFSKRGGLASSGGSSSPFLKEFLGRTQWLEILRRTDKSIITLPSGFLVIKKKKKRHNQYQ